MESLNALKERLDNKKTKTLIASVILIVIIIYLSSSFFVYKKRVSQTKLTLKYPEISNKADVIIEGKSKANQDISLFSGLSEIESVTSNRKGQFSFSSIHLKGETNTYSIKTYDKQNRIEEVKKIIIFLDQTPPDLIYIDYPKSPVYQSTITVKGQTEKNSKVFIFSEQKLIDSLKVDKKGFFEFSELKMKNGDNHLSLKIKDQAGNFNLKKFKFLVSYLTYSQDLANICANTLNTYISDAGGKKKKIIKINAPLNKKTKMKDDLVAEIYFRQNPSSNWIQLIECSLSDVVKIMNNLLKDEDFTYFKFYSYGSIIEKSKIKKECLIVKVEFSRKKAEEIDWKQLKKLIEKDCQSFLLKADNYYLNPNIFFESIKNN